MPTTYRLQIDRREFDALLKRLNAERLATPIKDGMREGSGELIEEVQKIIEPARDTGATKGSYKFDMKGSNLTSIQGRVYSDMISAGVLEEGRRAGMRPPPVKVIQEWARRKLGISDMGIAFAIARAIGREGSPKRRRGGSVQPYHQLETAAVNKVNAMRDAMLRRVRKAL
jgi:hypothetical protein